MVDTGLKNSKVFYGWWIVGAVFLISAYVAGVIFFGFTAIFEPIANEFGWSYAQVSLAASIRSMETSLLAPLLGLLLDRWGPRRLIFTGIAITGLGLLLLSRINSLAAFYGAFVLIAMGISTTSGLVPMAVVGNWFRRKVSTATGIVVSGTAVGGLLIPLVIRLIDIFDWRTAMVILGLGAWGIFMPLSLLVRHRPEQYGYLPDGDTGGEHANQESRDSAPGSEAGIGVKQVLKSGIYWHIALGMMCHMMVIHAVVTHVMPYLSSIGVPRSTSSLAASGTAIGSICGRLSFGWFGDRFDRRWLAAGGCLLISLSMMLFNSITGAGTLMIVLFLIPFGIGYGGPIPMMPALLREHFGRTRLGTVLGLALGVAALGTIAGPPLAGWIFDAYGSYRGAWFVFSGVALAGMVSFITTPAAGKVMPGPIN